MSRSWLTSTATALVVAVGAGLTACPAVAHDRGTSYSVWTVRDDRAHVSVRVSELDLSRFAWGVRPDEQRDAALRRYLPAHLRIERGGERCSLSEGPRGLRSAPGHVSYEWTLACPARGSYVIHSDLLAEVSPSHVHFARARVGDGVGMERVLSTRGARWDLGPGEDMDEGAGSTGFLGYFWLGVEHIITGYDHLAFVFVLLLLGRSLWEVAKIVTGFTLAHSITLGLMVLGYLRPEPEPIEALIGLSIALVAAENLWQTSGRRASIPRSSVLAIVAMAVLAGLGFGNVPALTLGGLALFTYCYFGLFATISRPETLRWTVAFLFGLIHGFGFAAMLTEAGLPADRVVSALVGFNLGVEAGQLAAVALVWPLLVAARRRRGAAHTWIVEGGSAAVLALGVFWLIERAYGA